MPSSNTVKIEKAGRRYYVRGETFAYRTALREAGCKWDPEAGAWWTGKAEVAEGLLTTLAGATAELRGAPTPLADGSWGVRVFSTTGVVPGATVHVSARSGKRWEAEVSRVERQDGNTTIVATVAKARAAEPIVQTQSRSRGRCRAKGCSATATTRGYCAQCAFDEFDD